jgi:HD-like signal output (HDOD) protein
VDLYKKCEACQREFRSDDDLRLDTTRWRMSSDGNLWFNCGCGAPLAISPTQVSWYTVDRFLSDKARKVMRELGEGKKVPYLAAATFKVQELLSNPESAPSDIARAIRQDPVLAGQVLAQANGMKISTGETITGIEHAVVYIGRRTLSELVLLASLRMMKFGTARYSSTEFWEEALLTANISEYLARRFGAEVNKDEAYLAGALANIGKVIAAVLVPESVDRVCTLLQEQQEPLTWFAAERKLGVVDHLVFGEIAFAMWGLPPQLLAVPVKHHELPAIGVSYKGLSVIECAALANQLMLNALGKTKRVDAKIMDPLMVRTGLPAHEYQGLRDQIYMWRVAIQKLLKT